MNTHPITKDTDIPFPCYLIKADGSGVYFIYDPAGIMRACKPDWDYVKDGGYTHYSTNPPDQRPEDVPFAQPNAKPALTQPDPSESLAKTLVGNLRAAFQEKDRAALDTLEIAWTAIISRHFEPLVRELAELHGKEEGYRKAISNYDDWIKRRSETVDQLRAENARLQMELDASCNSEELRQRKAEVERLKTENNSLRTLWTEARDVVTQGRNANCLASYGKAQCDAVAAANAWLDKMPETVKRTIDEASNAEWQLVRVIQERDALRERVHQRAFEAEQTARDLNKLRAEVARAAAALSPADACDLGLAVKRACSREAELRAENARLNKALTGEEERHGIRISECDDLRRRLAEAEEQRDALKAERASINETLAEFSRQNTALHQERDSIKLENNLRKTGHARLVEVLPDGDMLPAHEQVTALRARLAVAEEAAAALESMLEIASDAATSDWRDSVETARAALAKWKESNQ